MSKTALVRCGPIANHALLTSRADKRHAYNSVRLIPAGSPVVIDHDEKNVIGDVLELFTMRDVVPHGVEDARWLCAHVRLHDNAPGWIRKGTGASLSTIPFFETEINGFHVSRESLLKELTLCSSRTTPCEPLAQVLLIDDEKPEPAPVAAVPREIPYYSTPATRRERAEMDEYRRRVDAAGPNPDVELILRNLRAELGYNIGDVYERYYPRRYQQGRAA